MILKMEGIVQVKFNQVLRAARDHLEKLASRDYFWNEYSTSRDIGQALGIDEPTGDYWSNAAWKRFTDQVDRALVKLAEEGLLVRVTPKDVGPDGRSHRYTRYYFPESYARIKAAHDQEMTTVREASQRWEAVTARLSAVLGRDIGTTGRRPDLRVEEFELIADIMEGRK